MSGPKRQCIMRCEVRITVPHELDGGPDEQEVGAKVARALDMYQFDRVEIRKVEVFDFVEPHS